jgi:hypothetical protein
MSPEQCLGDEVDLRTDVFALGIVLYELTTGMRCFEGNDDFERMLAVVRGNYILPSSFDEGFPRDLENVIRTALSIDATKRYPTCAAMLDALERVARNHHWALGAATVQHAMRRLFGDVPEPWTTEPDVELAEVCATAAERTLRQPMVGFADTDDANPPEVIVELVDELCAESRPEDVLGDAIFAIVDGVPVPTVPTSPTSPCSPRRRLAAGSIHDMIAAAVSGPAWRDDFEDALTGRRHQSGPCPAPLAA